MLGSAMDKTSAQRIDRDRAVSVLKSVLAQNPNFQRVFTGWEPEAFDGMDGIYAGKNWNDDTGLFNPCWVRGADGEIRFTTLNQLDKQNAGNNIPEKKSIYGLASEQKNEIVTTPYPLPADGKTVWMTTVCVPIIAEGKF